MNDFWYDRPKETRDKISKSQKGNKYRWRPELDKPYAEVKALVAKGVSRSEEHTSELQSH